MKEEHKPWGNSIGSIEARMFPDSIENRMRNCTFASAFSLL